MKSFEDRARKVHGDKYDYSKVNYVNGIVKVEIICPEHGPFFQTPKKHLAGQGCPHKDCVKNKLESTNKERYGTARPLQNKTVQERAVETSMRVYGVSNPSMSHDVKQKRVETCQEKYGVDYSCQAHEVISKKNTTNQARYGGDSPFCSSEVRERAAETVFEKYGVDTVFKLESVQERIRQTCLAKYGVEYPSQSPEVRAKVVATNLKRYGCKSSLQNADVRERQKATMMARYGVEYSTQSPSVKSKVKQTCLQRYGVENPRQSCEIDDKIKQTSQERYGVDYVVQSSVVKAKANATKRLRGTFNTSKPADMVGQMLRSIFGVDDVMCEYDGDKRYPFHCDFYIKSRDLFIEMNLFVSHGGHFFNSDSFEDLKKVSVWREKALKSKFYENMVHVWTVSDVLKRETARKFGLNYLTFWKSDLSDFYEWLDAGCPDGQDWKQEYSWKF